MIGTYPTEDFDLRRLAEVCIICQPTAFIWRAPLEAVGMLNPTLRYCVDYDLWIRLGRRFPIDRIKRFLANSRWHRATKSFSGRDCGFAGDYVEAMWLMLQQDSHNDYVIGTGETHSVRDLVELAFGFADLDWKQYVVVDPALRRPAEVEVLQGDYSKARTDAYFGGQLERFS